MSRTEKYTSEELSEVLDENAIKEIMNAATADAVVPSKETPPLSPGVHGRMRKRSYALPLIMPIPDAAVSANASARAATNAIINIRLLVSRYSTEQTEAIRPFAITWT